MNKTVLLLLLCVTGLFCSKMRQNELLANETDTNLDMDDRTRDRDRDDDYDDDDDMGGMGGMGDMMGNFEDFMSNSTMWNMTNLELNLNYDSRFGNFLVGPNQRTLYMFDADHIGTGYTEADFNITCYDQCAYNWPPVIVHEGTLEISFASGLNSALISKRLRDDGFYQLTYNNIPLYFYYKDIMPGDTLGHNVYADGGYWYLIDTLGLPIKL